MKGWNGKLLRINLTTSETFIDDIPPEVLNKYIGGRGLAGYFLKPHVTEKWDSPEMPLLFFTGPLVDTPSPASGRMTIMSRSPLTGTIGDTSVGGRLAIMIKRSGLDGILITGKRDRICGIEINDSSVTISDAGGLRGKTTDELRARIRGKGSVASVGPAAENGVLFASIAIDGHFFSGRNGLGLVMADKGIKYISVSGTGKTDCFNRNEVMKAREEIFRLTAASPVIMGELGISEYGTGTLYDLMNSRRMMPTDNFRKTIFSSAPLMNAFSYREKYNTKKTGCAGCHVQCKKKGSGGEIIPEFETMSHFSALLENSDMDTVVEANRICNSLGMDTISAAATLSCFSEINGITLTPAMIKDLLIKTGYSRNEGSELKTGSRRYAELKGKPETSITVKGQELPAYDPRGAYGMALGYAVSTRGGCHLRAYPISHEILRKPVATDRFSFSGKARIIKLNEDLNAVIDSLTACKFIFFAASLEEYARAYSGVTGVATTAQDLMKAGERIVYNERTMNSSNGFTADDDDLPGLFFREEGSSGNGIEIKKLERDEFLEARKKYYQVRGLDKNGMPREEKTKELGLD
jgi:aldehyde:ferredoxin oxidoreductase